MTDQDIKRNIETALKSFSSGSFSKNALALFGALGYNTARQNPFVHKTTAEFEENFGHAFSERQPRHLRKNSIIRTRWNFAKKQKQFLENSRKGILINGGTNGLMYRLKRYGHIIGWRNGMSWKRWLKELV